MSDAAPVLALPGGAEAPKRHTLPVAAGLASVSSLLVFVSLLGAYVATRAASRPWPPAKVSLDRYMGNMLTITLLLSAITVQWGVSSMRRGNLRQAVAGFTLTPLFGLAFLNLLWYLGTHIGFGAGSHPYGTLVWAFIAAIGFDVVLGMAFILLTLARIAGRQVTAASPDMARAVGWFWQSVVVAWLITFVALYVFQRGR